MVLQFLFFAEGKVPSRSASSGQLLVPPMHYGTSRGQRTSNYQSHQGGIDVDSVMEMGRKERLLEVRPEADRERRLELKGIGRIRLSVSTVNRTYELSGITHVTPFRKYGKHSTGPSTYGPWARTYSKLFSCKPVLTVCSYGAQSNEICTYGRVSRGTIPRVRRYGLLYLRTVEYDH